MCISKISILWWVIRTNIDWSRGILLLLCVSNTFKFFKQLLVDATKHSFFWVHTPSNCKLFVTTYSFLGFQEFCWNRFYPLLWQALWTNYTVCNIMPTAQYCNAYFTFFFFWPDGIVMLALIVHVCIKFVTQQDKNIA